MSERRRSPVDTETTEPHLCSVGLRLEILGKVPFFAGLPAGQLEQVNRLFHETGYEPGESIYFEGDPAGRLHVVADGRVKLVRHTSTGKNVLLDLLVPGEFFGSLSGHEDAAYEDTAQALTSACVLSISAADFRKVLDAYPAVALKVLDIMAVRLKAAHERVRQLSAHPAEHRIAYTLLRLAEKLGEPQDVGLLIQAPLSRDDLAEMTGTTTETTSRVMSQLQKDGLIRTGRQWVAIADRPGLEALVEE